MIPSYSFITHVLHSPDCSCGKLCHFKLSSISFPTPTLLTKVCYPQPKDQIGAVVWTLAVGDSGNVERIFAVVVANVVENKKWWVARLGSKPINEHLSVLLQDDSFAERTPLFKEVKGPKYLHIYIVDTVCTITA
jgi:hypothetical protein